jgi:hypothetical protein
MRNAPTNTDDVIDSRDIIERIEELEEEREAIDGEAENDADAEAIAEALEAWDAENGAELKALTTLQEEAEGYAPDWRHGCTLIRDSYFVDYARNYAHDVCDLPTHWPASCIDWDQAASELQQDYTAVEFDGVTYWVR